MLKRSFEFNSQIIKRSEWSLRSWHKALKSRKKWNEKCYFTIDTQVLSLLLIQFCFLFLFPFHRERFDLRLSIVMANRVKESNEKWRTEIITRRDWMFVEEAKGSISKDEQNLSQCYRATTARCRGRNRVLRWWARWKDVPLIDTQVGQFTMSRGSERSNRTSIIKRIHRLRHELGQSCFVLEYTEILALLTTAHRVSEYFKVLLNIWWGCRIKKLKFNLRFFTQSSTWAFSAFFRYLICIFLN